MGSFDRQLCHKALLLYSNRLVSTIYFRNRQQNNMNSTLLDNCFNFCVEKNPKQDRIMMEEYLDYSATVHVVAAVVCFLL